MNLLEAEQQISPVAASGEGADVLANDTPLAADLLAPVSAAPQTSAVACRGCGASVGPGQQWCLECGAAVAPPRRLPGLGAIAVAGGLALLLAVGAAAAAYAALKDSTPPRQTTVEMVAQVTPAPVVADPGPTTEVPAPADPLPPPTTLEPVTPAPPATITTPPTTTPTTPTTPPAPTPPAHPRIVIDEAAGALYDPAALATSAGDPTRALDGNVDTSWFASTVLPTDGTVADMKVGYVIDLGAKSDLSKLEILTKTPGFTVTVLAANGLKAPPAADDPKWTKLAEAGAVDGDGPVGVTDPVAPVEGDKAGDKKLLLKLDAKTKQYRYVLLWVTTPPAAGPTVRFNEIKLWA